MIIPEKYTKFKSREFLEGFKAGLEFVNEYNFDAQREAHDEIMKQIDREFQDYLGGKK